MKKIISFLKESGHGLHIAGGLAVGLLALSPFAALYAAAVAASCLEFKDRQHGGLWDWADWLCTFAGGAAAALILLML